jgi:hypothetical protein
VNPSSIERKARVGIHHRLRPVRHPVVGRVRDQGHARLGQPYPAGTAHYRDIDYVSIAFTTDAARAAALIPAELQLIPIPGLPIDLA